MSGEGKPLGKDKLPGRVNGGPPSDALLCIDLGQGFCSAAVDGYCVGGYIVEGDDWRRCHG